jgi:hypothetical protein
MKATVLFKFPPYKQICREYEVKHEIMSELEAIKNKIIKWVNNDYSAQFKAVKQKNMILKNLLFC